MQIRHLSHKELEQFGRILPQSPSADGRHKKTRLNLVHAEQIAQYKSDRQVVLDYVSGMSVLVIFGDDTTEAFYLDRVVALRPGVRFSLFPMADTCCVDVLVSEPLQTVGLVPVDMLQSSPKGLQFDRIYTFLYQQCRHNFYFRGEKHKPYELVYVDRGELHNLAGGQDILLDQQSFMIIDSNDWHTQYSDFPVSFLTVSFWAADPRLHLITGQRFAATRQLMGLFQKMLSQSGVDPYAGEYTESLLKILLLELLRKADTDIAPLHLATGRPENQIVDRAIQLISENLYKKLTLEELAGMVHVSVPYLYKLFDVHLGTSPGKYIAKIRIEEGKMLLREEHLTMGQIAERMGYSSPQQFSRQFHSICGITPTQYIRSLR